MAEARQVAHERRVVRARRLQHDERFDALRTLTARRVLVVLGFVLAALGSGLIWRDAGGLSAAAGYAVFLAGFGVYALLQRVLRQSDDAPDEALDERLAAARDAATRTAYQILGTATVAALLVLLLVVRDAAGRRHIEALFLGFALVAVLLPSAVRAWREREV
jgi:hypothetical protein